MANNYPGASAAFDKVLEDFKKDLRKRDQEIFKITTFEEMQKCIAEVQTKQHSERRVLNLNRLTPFIEAVEQFGRLVRLFCNSDEYVAFVWVGIL